MKNPNTKRDLSLDRYLLVRGVLIALIVFGVFLVCFQANAYYRAHQSRTWPTTAGSLFITVGEYRRTLLYRYSVDGASYTSDRVIFGELGDRNRSKEWMAVSDLPNGHEVDVYYMPENPRVSTLTPKVREGSWFNFVLGAAFLLAPSGVLVAFPTLKRIAEQAGRGDGDKPSN
jgi:hypothetical protein